MSFDPRTEYRDRAVAETYDQQRFASLSGRIFQACEHAALRRILGQIAPGTRVLDAPCGTGRHFPLLRACGLEPVGADISPEMLTVAARRDPRAEFWPPMDLSTMPLKTRSVPVVLSMRFLVHYSPDDRALFLREFARVATDLVIFSASISTPWHRLRRRIKARLGHDAPVRHPVTRAALDAELRHAGLIPRGLTWTCPLLSEQALVVTEP